MVQIRWCDLYVADFETTVDEDVENQDSTEVWAGGFADVRAESFAPILTTSISDFWDTLVKTVSNKKNIVYFHNERFDGSYLLTYLLEQGYTHTFNEEEGKWMKDSEMPNHSFRTVISKQNEWYEIGVHIEGKKYIYIRDSIKLLPFSLADIGKSIGYEKLDLDYIKNRHAGDAISEDEEQYLIRDIEILYYALRKFIVEENHTGMTIGSCCKTEYQRDKVRDDLSYYFPNIAKDGYDSWFRRAYHGGICYVNPNVVDKVVGNGITLDMNSMYPYVMDSERKYPIGKPHPFEGPVPRHVFHREKTYFVHFKCRFYLKSGNIPWVKIHNSPYYSSTENLVSSAPYFDGEYHETYTDENGVEHPFIAELIMNEVDWKLFYKTYSIKDLEIIDGAWFWTEKGTVLFGDYINKYKTQKMESEGIDRTISKLFLNNLQGKLSAKPERTTRVPYLDDKGRLRFKTYTYEDKGRAWYIPAATYVTAYGRELLIDAIRENYEHFLYCDTDSLHLSCNIVYAKHLHIDGCEFGSWKLERKWCKAIFHNLKQYIEQELVDITDDGKSIYDTKIICSGMCKRSRELLKAKLDGVYIEPKSEKEVEWIQQNITISDFVSGFSMPGGLASRRVKGGTVLIPIDFTLL